MLILASGKQTQCQWKMSPFLTLFFVRRFDKWVPMSHINSEVINVSNVVSGLGWWCSSSCLSAAAQLLSISESGLCRSSSAHLLRLLLPRTTQNSHLLCPRCAADHRGGSPHHDPCCLDPHSSCWTPVLRTRGASAWDDPAGPQQRGGLSRGQWTYGGCSWISVSDPRKCTYNHNMSTSFSRRVSSGVVSSRLVTQKLSSKEIPVGYNRKSRVLLSVFYFRSDPKTSEISVHLSGAWSCFEIIYINLTYLKRRRRRFTASTDIGSVSVVILSWIRPQVRMIKEDPGGKMTSH